MCRYVKFAISAHTDSPHQYLSKIQALNNGALDFSKAEQEKNAPQVMIWGDL